jgi:outer membrane receptor protein involved in Fe transport
MMRTRLFAVGLCCLALAWATAGRSLGQEAGEGAPPAAGPGREEPAEEGGEGGERPVDLGKIVVTAEREKSGYAQDVILAEDVAQARRSADVDGLLKDLAGVQLSRQSSAGSDSNRVRLRGFDESRSLILFNGRSLHGAGVYGGYYVDWSSLSLEEVERVEIIRGAGPAKHGNTLGGVVNIVTREGTESPRTVVRSAGGNLGTWDAQASHSGGVDRLRYSLAASHYETDGYLRNASVDREALAARFALKLPAEMELTAGVRFTENECGMTVYNRPDSPYYDYRKPKSLESQLGGPYVPFLNHNWGPKDWGDGSYWKDEKWQFDWGLSRETEESGFLLQAYLFDESREEYFYAMDDPRHLALQRESKPEDRNWGWRADFHNLLEFAGQHKIEYGLEGHYLSMQPTSLSGACLHPLPVSATSHS